MLIAERIHRTYGRGERAVRVLEALDLCVAERELRVIAGRSGSGKTTLLHILAGLDQPDEGVVRFGELELRPRASERELLAWRRNVGFLHQTPALIPTLTAWENAMLPFRYAGKADPDWMRELFEQLELSDLRQRSPKQLSGGQATRVALARALARQPRLFLADEPTGRLDADTALQVWALIERLCQRLGSVAVVVTHDPIILERCSSVQRVHKGQLVDGAASARYLPETLDSSALTGR